jgi:hypothetical protein
LPEALARMRREPTLSVPAREAVAPRRTKAVTTPGRIFRVLPRTLGGFVGLLFCAALIGVIANAVGFQHERRPAPLPSTEPAAQAPAVTPVARMPTSQAAEPTPAATLTRPDVAPTPVARPAATTTKKGDAIGDLLRNGAVADSSKDLISAQRTLIKLGYDIEADGVMGAGTERALRDFEKSHGLPASTEITPKLIAKLNAAAK